MITAVDSNVLIDILGGDAEFGPRSLRAVRACLAQGSLIACEVVWAEVSGSFPDPDAALDAMLRFPVAFAPMNADAALAAGAAWREYRRRGGSRTRVVSDFLIGAHALTDADRLLTRDRGFYRSYFKELEILDPSA